MEMDLMKYFLTQGPFAVLFVWLLVYVMRNNRERERQLHQTLNEFASRYDIVIDELREIKDRLPRR